MPLPFVVLVCGGRDYHDRKNVYATLDALHSKRPIDAIMQGHAAGADQLAEDWAKSRQVPYIGVPAKWGQLGRRAGGERNSRMLVFMGIPISLVVAFPGGVGTLDMVTKAARKDIPIQLVKPDSPASYPPTAPS